LKSHPEDKRTAEEEQELKKNNIFEQDTVDVCKIVTGKAASSLDAGESSSGMLLKSGRAPGVVLKSNPVTKTKAKKTAARKGSDLSAKSSDDEDGSSKAVCRECMVERNKFKCSPSQAHVTCSNCRKLIAARDDDSLQQRCVICEEYFCNLYFPPCKSSGNKLTLVSERFRSAKIDKDNFRGNDYELSTYTNYLLSKKLSARNVFDMMIRDYLNKDQFRYLSDRKILTVGPAVSHEVTVRGDSAVCDVCWKQLWFQMVLRHRMNINSELPPAVSGRADCYYGINCTTMSHKLDHAKKLNHCCYQTRFH
jgi:E3 ubiquitin-protein ligase CHFR